MNCLVKDLEELRITGNRLGEPFWHSGTELIRKTFAPQKTFATERPCEEKDFREYRIVVDRNLRNIKSILQLVLENSNKQDLLPDCNLTEAKGFIFNLLLLIGEHHEKNIWNTAESVSLSNELSVGICAICGCESISEFLMGNGNFNTALLMLRPKLLQDTWKTYPAAISCYKWLLHEAKMPLLFEHISDVLPTVLIILDDYVPENVAVGLECLYLILQHSYMKKGLVEMGYTEVIYHALQRLSHRREAKYIMPLYSCMANLLNTMDHWNKDLNVFEWTKRDDVLATLLDNMELEQTLELRYAYMTSLPQLLSNIGCAKWCERITRILSEYCEHHTDLRTLKATLTTAKSFLMLFHLRVAAHCTPLYTTFLKLHFDLTETPVFDKEIMQNLEDCICMLYKLSPNIGCSIMRDDRIRSVVKNGLQIVCPGDITYFQ